MRLLIINQKCDVYTLEAEKHWTVDCLKTKAVSHFSSERDAVKQSVYFKLILVQRATTLSETKSLQEQGLGNNDEVLLVPRRPVVPDIANLQKEKRFIKTAFAEDVYSATADEPIRNESIAFNEPEKDTADTWEWKPLLVTLADVSHTIHCMDSGFESLFAEAEKVLQNASSDVLHRPDVTNNNNSSGNTETKPDLITAQKDDVTCQSSQDAQPVRAWKDQVGGSLCYVRSREKVTALLTAFRTISRQKFSPDERVVPQMMEMGYTRDDVIEALRVFENNAESAVRWLMNNCHVTWRQDLPEGVDSNSDLYERILNSAKVQLALSSPVSLIALLAMLDAGGVGGRWLNHPDLGQMLEAVAEMRRAGNRLNKTASSDLLTTKL